MTPLLPKSPVRLLEITEGQIDSYGRHGYLVIPDILEPNTVGVLREEVLAVMGAMGFNRARLDRSEETADKLRQVSVYKKGSLLDGLINGAPSLVLASRLIGGPARRYLPFTAVKAGGGGGKFHFHQDNNYTQHDPALGSINIWVALEEMTLKNGCLLVAPDSHVGGVRAWVNADEGDDHRKVVVDPAGAVPVLMRPGDAVAFTRLTVHGSGPNTSDQARIAYALQYHREDVKFLNTETGEWKLLLNEPRFQTPPVEHL
jgi:phytanoyl-CoA hydroxylase